MHKLSGKSSVLAFMILALIAISESRAQDSNPLTHGNVQMTLRVGETSQHIAPRAAPARWNRSAPIKLIPVNLEPL